MERDRRAAMISFFTQETLAAHTEMALGDDAVGHAHAKRVEAGERARLLDGRGSIAAAELIAVEKRRVLVRVIDVTTVERPRGLEVLVPVADKDRMLVAAEKCAELQVTLWRPVQYARSRSVTTRGEGPKFREKVVARMQSALEQSGGAWLPEVAAEAGFEEALDASGHAKDRLILDSRGTSIATHISHSDIALAIGPEGGFEEAELRAAQSRDWRSVALAETILRFETAIISAVGVVRALQLGR